MGIYGAMTTAVTGLRAQSKALELISGNVANSQTTGYKRSESNFVDLITDSDPSQQKAGGAIALSRATNNVQGDIQSADKETYMAVNGDGYFVVDTAVGRSDNAPVFSGQDLYTRRGDFEVDRDGFLVNGAGYYLKGYEIDPNTGNPSGSVVSAIQVTNDFLDAETTTQIDYRANLPSYPLSADADKNTPDSELMNLAYYSVAPTTATGPDQITGAEASTFVDDTVSGGAITTYTSTGQAVNVQFRWAKVDSVESGGIDTWNLYYLVDTDATGAATAWQNAGVDYDFDSNGQMTAPATGTVTLSAVTVDNTTVGNINMIHGTTGITQFSDANGTVKVTELAQNGYPAGELVGVSVSDTGRVVATYTNNQQVEIAEVVLASFNADNKLRKLDGGAFAATSESGTAILGANGSIIGSALEASNVDIADEFTKLIITQQAYAANTRIVTSADEMLQEALNMVR
ncbi:MAG: flagellar hook-basal body complex protein [Hyphomicrobiales bacterium]|nr:flagellar hook-basal body complex protein [Hyphomicrobiales bacterium]